MTKIQYYEVIKISLISDSIIHIGSDVSEDLGIICDKNGNPYIPGSSIAGVIKSFLNKVNPNFEKYIENEKTESKLYFYDSFFKDYNKEMRSGIRQDYEYGGAADSEKALYTEVYLSKGTKFDLLIEGFADDKKEKEEIRNCFFQIIYGIENKHIGFGAKRSIGAGEVSIVKNNKKKDIKYISWDLSKKSDLIKYLKGWEERNSYFLEMKEEDYKINEDSKNGYIDFILKGNIKDALLIKSSNNDYLKEGRLVDYINLKSNDKYIIPGSTIKGMLRSYSSKILNTLEINFDETNIFGDKAKEKNNKKKSKVYTSDVFIEEEKESVYNRIKISRFLGSNMDGTKFDEIPISGKVEIKIHYERCKDERINNIAFSLLFLCLRELGCGNIPIGSGASIGYGRIIGENIIINGTSEKEIKAYFKYDQKQGLYCIDLKEIDEEIINNKLSTLKN